MRTAFVLFSLLALASFASALVDIQIPNPLPASPSSAPGTLENQDTFQFSLLSLSGTIGNDGPTQQEAGNAGGQVRPCEWDFIKVDASAFSDYQIGDYLNILANVENAYTESGSDHPNGIPGEVYLYVKYSAEGDVLPTVDDFDWMIEVTCDICDGAVSATDPDHFPQQVIELAPCETHNVGAYWLGIRYVADGSPSSPTFDSADPVAVNYQIRVARRRVLGHCSGMTMGECDTMIDTIPVSLFGELNQVIVNNETRPSGDITNGFWPDANPCDTTDTYAANTVESWQAQDQIRNWRFFKVEVPAATFFTTSNGATRGSEGSYLTINITDVHRDLSAPKSEVHVKLSYGHLPYTARTGGYLPQTNSDGQTVYTVGSDICEFWGEEGGCASTGDEIWAYAQDDDVACECDPDNFFCWNDPDQEFYTCSIVVSPCHFRYGTYFVSVYVPNTNDCLQDEDDLDYTAWKISAHFVRPSDYGNVLALEGNGMMGVTTGAYIDLAQHSHFTHYYFDVDESERYRNFELVAENVQGGEISVYLRGPDYASSTAYEHRLASPICAGDRECREQWSMDVCRRGVLAIPFCEFEPGRYYVAVAPAAWDTGYKGSAAPAQPIEYQLYWRTYDDENAMVISTGMPVHGSISTTDRYAFYVLSVSDIGADASLYLELFQDSMKGELSVSVSSAGQPGGECYGDHHYYCETKRSSSYSGENGCYYVLDACELSDGPLFITVRGIDGDFDSYPIEYTLWADFEYPMTLQNNVTYSDVVHFEQYNHYVFHAESVVQGSYLTVAINNVRTHRVQGSGLPNSQIESFINYGAMAGTCPCYSSLFNCTGGVTADECGDYPECGYDWLDDSHRNLPVATYDYWDGEISDDDCCKHHIDACNFRSGAWYVSVLAWDPDASAEYEDARDPYGAITQYADGVVSYTITARVHPAPPVYALPMGENLVDWVEPEHLNHYLLTGGHVPGHRLVIRLVWAQENCGTSGGEYYSVPDQAPHQMDDNDNLQVRISAGNLALQHCYDAPWSCRADKESFSECSIVVPECAWKDLAARGNLFVSVYGDHADDSAQYTIRAEAEPIETYELEWNTPTYGSTLADRYVHYAFDVSPQTVADDQTFTVDIYYHKETTNTVYSDTDIQRPAPVFALRVGAHAGNSRQADDDESDDCGADCGKMAEFACNHRDSCHWEFEACDLARLGYGRYYLSVYSPNFDFSVMPLEYTVTIGTRDSTTQVLAGSENRIRDWAWNLGERYGTEYPHLNDADNSFALSPYRHYRYTHEEATTPDQWLEIRVGALTSDDVKIFFSREGKAGDCPCYSNEYFIECGSDTSCPSVADVGSWEYLYDHNREDNVGFCKIIVPPCQFGPGVYSFSVLPLSNGAIDVSRWTVEVLVHSATIVDELPAITNTNANGAVVHFGVTPGFQYWDDIIDLGDGEVAETANQYFAWNSANVLNDQILDNNQWAHYLVTPSFTGAGLVVQIFLDNVRSERCWSYDATSSLVSAYYSPNEYYRSFSENCAFDCETAEYSEMLEVGNGARHGGAHYEIGCPAASFYVSIEAHTETEFDDFDRSIAHFDYTSGYNHVTFDFKAFEQHPIALSEGRNSILNVTHLWSGVQRFRLEGVDIDSLVPLLQFSTEDVDFGSGQIRSVKMYPASQSPCEECDFTECTEFRPAVPFANSRLDLETGGSVGPDVNQAFFDCDFGTFARGSDYNAGAVGYCGGVGHEQCSWSVMGCGLRDHGETTWFVEVDADAGTFYSAWWQNTDTGASSITAIPAANIASRTMYPFSNREDEDTRVDDDLIFIDQMDEFAVFSFEVSGIDDTVGDYVGGNNGTAIPNRQFKRLEVQIYEGLTSEVLSNSLATEAPILVTIRRADSDDVIVYPNINDDMWENGDECTGCVAEQAYRCVDPPCTGGDRFYVPSCSLRDGTYHIVVRQLAPGRRNYGFRVRLVEQKEDGVDLVEEIDAADLASNELTPIFEVEQDNMAYVQVTRSSFTSEGLEPGNFHHYVIDLSDRSLFYDDSQFPPIERSLTMAIANDFNSVDNVGASHNAGNFGRLWLTARFDQLSGWSPDASSEVYSYGNSPSGGVIGSTSDSNVLSAGGYGSTNYDDRCFSLSFACNLDDGSNLDERCAFEIPARQLKTGMLYFSVYHDQWESVPPNPLETDIDDEHWRFQAYRGYNVTAFFRDMVADTSNTVTGDGAASGFCLTERAGYDFSSFGASAAFLVEDAALYHGSDYLGSEFIWPSINNVNNLAVDASFYNLGFRAFYAFEVTAGALTDGCTGNEYCRYEKRLVVSVRNELIAIDDTDVTDRDSTFNAAMNFAVAVPHTAWRRGEARELASYPGFRDEYHRGLPGTHEGSQSSIPNAAAAAGRFWEYSGVAWVNGLNPLDIDDANFDENNDFCNFDGFSRMVFGTCKDAYAMDGASPEIQRAEVRAGWYYVTVETQGYNQYSICAHLEHTLYEEQARSSFVDPIRGEQVTQLIQETYSDSDGDDNNFIEWHYSFEISEADISSQLNYLVVNFTDINPAVGAFDSIEIWNDQCQRWEWSRDTREEGGYWVEDDSDSPSLNNNRRLVFDDEGLALCALEAGRYWVDIVRNSACNEVDDEYTVSTLFGFNLKIELRTAVQHTLTAGVPVQSTIYEGQFHVYELTVSGVEAGATINFEVYDVSCGEVAVYAKQGSPAGPPGPFQDGYFVGSRYGEGYPSSFTEFDDGDADSEYPDYYPGDQGTGTGRRWGSSGAVSGDPSVNYIPRAPLPSCETCSIQSCSTSSECEINIDSYELHVDANGESVFYFSVWGIDQDYYFADVHSVPAAYKVVAWVDHEAEESVAGFGCPHVMPGAGSDDSYDCDEVLVPGTPSTDYQMVFEVAHVPFGTEFVLRRLNWDVEGGTTEYSFGSPLLVGDDDDTAGILPPDYYEPQTFTSAFHFNHYDVDCRAFRLWVRGSADWQYTLSRHEPYVPLLYPGQYVTGSVFYDKFVDTEFPVVLSDSQYYRMPSFDEWNPSAMFFRLVVDYVHHGSVRISALVDTETTCHYDDSTASWTFDDDDTYPRQTVLYRDCAYGSCTGGEIIRVWFNDNDDCEDDKCLPVEYGFHYTWGDELSTLECDKPQCDEVESRQTFVAYPQTGAQYRHYHLSPSASLDPTSVRVADAVYQAEVLRIEVESPISFSHRFSSDGLVRYDGCGLGGSSDCGLSNGVGTNYKAVYDRVCAFDDAYFSLEFNFNYYDTAVANEVNEFRVARYCDPVDVTDITSALNDDGVHVLGGVCGVADSGRFYFSFVPDFAPGEYTYLEVAAVNADVYFQIGALADDNCAVESLSDETVDISCVWQANQGEVWYMTVDAPADVWSVVLTVRGPSNGFPSTELVVGEKSGHLEAPSDNLYHLFYVDVDSAPAPDEYMVFYLTHSGHASFYGYAGMEISNQNQENTCQLDRGFYTSRDLDYQQWDETSISRTTNPLTISMCHFTQPGRYFFNVRGTGFYHDEDTITMQAWVQIKSNDLNIGALTVGTAVSDSAIYDFWAQRQDSINVYSWTSTGAVASARVFNVRGGEMDMFVQYDAPYVRKQGYLFPGRSSEPSPATNRNENFEYSDEICLPTRWCSSNQDFDVNNGEDNEDVYYNANVGCSSCEVWLTTCELEWSDNWFVTLRPYNGWEHGPISYELVVDEWAEYERLQPGVASATATLSDAPVTARETRGDGNVQSWGYRIDTDRSLAALVLEVAYTSEFPDDTITVTIHSNSDCNECGMVEFECRAGDPAWMCAYDLATWADVYDNVAAEVYYIRVTGHYGSFSVSYTAGADNCADPTDALSFCSDTTPSTPVWGADFSFAARDSEASCFYDTLVELFENPDAAGCGYESCSYGITAACEAALKEYACARSFRTCSGSGFVQGFPIELCHAVEEHCAVAWTSVGLPNLSCSSGLYVE